MVLADNFQASALSIAPIRLKQLTVDARNTSILNGVMDGEASNILGQFGTNLLADAYDSTDHIEPVQGARFAEWSVNAPLAGDYYVSARYAAATSRPLDVSVNGVLVINGACGSTTGGWNEGDRQTFPLDRITFNLGSNTVRFTVHACNQDFPHLNQVFFSPALS